MNDIIKLLCGLMIISCSPASIIQLKDNTALDQLAICVTYEEGFPEEYTAAVDNILNNYISTKHPRNFELVKCTDGMQTGAMNLHFTGLGLVTGDQQGLATLGNVVGLFALPVALASSESDYIFFFWIFPNTKAGYDLSFSESITDQPVKPMIHLSPGYLKNPVKQMYKNAERLEQTLDGLIGNLDREYVKHVNMKK